MGRKEKKILLVDNYDSFTFNLSQLVESCGWQVDVAKNDVLSLELCSNYSKILISPGAGLPSEAGEICFFIKALAKTHAILGICLGHQAIAKVFGGEIFPLLKPMHGRNVAVAVKEKQNSLFAGISSPFRVGLYHSWAVEPSSLPKELCVTAVGENGTIMGLRHAHYDIQGIQFHPESIMTPIGKKLINNWLSAPILSYSL